MNAGVDLKSQHRDGLQEASDLAMCNGHADIIYMLLFRGVLLSKTIFGEPIFQNFIRRGLQRRLCYSHGSSSGQEEFEIIKLLLRAGVEVNVTNMVGKTLLHKVIGNAGMVELLLAAGAACNIQDDYGRTPLHSAIREGTPEIVEQLLAAGASADIRHGRNRDADLANHK